MLHFKHEMLLITWLQASCLVRPNLGMAGIVRKCRACNRPVKGHQGPVGEKRCTNPRLGEEEQQEAVDGAGDASATSKAKIRDEVEAGTAAVAKVPDATAFTAAVKLDGNVLKENVVRKLKKTKGKKAKVAEDESGDETAAVSRTDMARVEASKEDDDLEDEPMEKKRKKKVVARIETGGFDFITNFVISQSPFVLTVTFRGGRREI